MLCLCDDINTVVKALSSGARMSRVISYHFSWLCDPGQFNYTVPQFFFFFPFGKYLGMRSLGHMIGVSLTHSVQFSHSCPTLCDPMNPSTPGLPVQHQLLEFTQIHVHRVGDAVQPSHPLSSPSLPAPNPSQHQGLFQWANSSHEVAKVLEFHLKHQSFQ